MWKLWPKFGHSCHALNHHSVKLFRSPESSVSCYYVCTSNLFAEIKLTKHFEQNWWRKQFEGKEDRYNEARIILHAFVCIAGKGLGGGIVLTNAYQQISYILRLESNNYVVQHVPWVTTTRILFYQTKVYLISPCFERCLLLEATIRGPEALTHTYKKQPLGGWMSSLWIWHLIEGWHKKAIWNRNNPHDLRTWDNR